MKKKIPYGTKVPVRCTVAERALMLDHLLGGTEFLKVCVVKDGCVELEMSLDEIEELQGYVAAEANHTDDARLQGKLDRLFSKLEKYLAKYDDQE